MTRADDLRAAARWIDGSCGERTEIGDGLRQHADAIERIEREMREWVWTVERTPSRVMGEWADALRGDKP